MAYMLLIMEPLGQRATRTRAEGERCFASMLSFGADLKARGLLRATESLKTGGVRVSAPGGKQTFSDGPFAEAKELVGGFFLLDCTNQEQAVAIAAQCPAAAWATIEVREVAPCYES